MNRSTPGLPVHHQLPEFTQVQMGINIPGASQVALVVKNPPAKAGNVRRVGLIPVSGSSPGGGHSNPFQYSCLESPMVRGAWPAAVHEVAKSWTRLNTYSLTHIVLV